MGGVGRIRTTPEQLRIGIAIVAPDGTIEDANTAWSRLCERADPDGSDVETNSNVFQVCTTDQARHLHEVVDGRLKLFTCLQACGPAQAPTLLVALPRGRVCPHQLLLLQVSMAGLLPVESAVDMASGASFPDESVFGIEVILQAIEQAMQSVIATNAVRVSPSADPATEAGAEQDAIVQLLGLLTPRQREILKLIGVGKSNTEIAALLGISMNTAKLHVSAILRRLDLDSRLQAVALGARIASDRF